MEAILSAISTYNSKQCHLEILKYDVGIVTEQDVEMAAPFNGLCEHFDINESHCKILLCGKLVLPNIVTRYFVGIIYAFNTKVPPNVATLASAKNVPIKEHNVIYKLIDDLRDELTERLEPLEEEVIIGTFTGLLFEKCWLLVCSY